MGKLPPSPHLILYTPKLPHHAENSSHSLPQYEWHRGAGSYFSVVHYQGKYGVPIGIGSAKSRLQSSTELYPLFQLRN